MIDPRSVQCCKRREIGSWWFKKEFKNSLFVGFFFKEFILIFLIKGLEWKVCAFVICC